MIETIFFIAGFVLGIISLRYGFGLGVKSVYQIQQDRVLDKDGGEIVQENTSEYQVEEKE